jgi:hypothetical protein
MPASSGSRVDPGGGLGAIGRVVRQQRFHQLRPDANRPVGDGHPVRHSSASQEQRAIEMM